MKLVRIAALLIALAGAAAVVFLFSKPGPATGAGAEHGGTDRGTGAGSSAGVSTPGAATGADGTTGGTTGSPPAGASTGTLAPFDPEPGRPATATPKPAVAGPQSTEQLFPTTLQAGGTPVEPSKEVSVAIPWSRGATPRSRYEIVDMTVTKDRETEHVNTWTTTLRLAAEVIEGGSAPRVRVTVDYVECRFLLPSGAPIIVNSTEGGDDGVLSDPVLARQVKPMFAMIGQPLQFTLGPTGAIADVDGADVWRERFLTEVQRIEKSAVTDTPDAPTRARIVDTWGEYLFPNLGGGTVSAAAKRPYRRVEPYAIPWAIVWTGTVVPTHDDADEFRAEIRATPEAAEIGGVATTPLAAGISKIRAIPDGHGYRAQYRVSRKVPGVAAAAIHARYQIWESRRAGGSAAAPEYARRFGILDRRVTVRRTEE